MTRCYAFVPFLLLLLLPFAAQAQDATFTVTVETKTADHPYNGQGWPQGYVIDGDQGAELELVRGRTYVFQMSGVPTVHPFFISTSEAGGDGGTSTFTDGVTGNGASGNGTLTFVVPDDAPDELWYQCQNHARMGYRLTIINATSTEDDAQPSALTLDAAFPNPFAEQTTLMLTLATPQDVAVEVFSTSGRRVATLHRGLLSSGRAHPFTLDATGLADGTYVVRATAGERTVERRVTLVR